MSLDARRKNQLIDQFVDFTQSNSSVAKNFLLLARWDLEVAINEYLAYQQPPNASRKDKKSILAIFDEYKDEEDKIGIDGTLRFIEDLGYEPEDRAVLALAEFLESPSVGVFPRKNFLSKWQSVNATTIEAMKQYVDQLDKRLITDPDYLKKVYKFTFGFLLEDGQKTLPLETAIAYWDLLLTPVYGAKVGIWCDFLNESWKRAISKDTWNMFYVFLQDWDKDPELKLYDEEAAWPSLIDEFVEHVHDDSDKSKD